MERYNGEGEPPYIEFILKADFDDSPDLSLPVTLTGVKHPSNMLTLVVIPKGTEANLRFIKLYNSVYLLPISPVVDLFLLPLPQGLLY